MIGRLTHKAGPLPVYAWILAAIVTVVLYRRHASIKAPNSTALMYAPQHSTDALGNVSDTGAARSGGGISLPHYLFQGPSSMLDTVVTPPLGADGVS